MSTTNNFYRPKRHFRSVFREGKFLLNTEATEIQLEVLDRLREQVKQAYGPSVSIKDGMLVEADATIGRVIIRPGYSYVDGYPLALHSAEDPIFNLGISPDEFTAADFVKVPKASGEAGGLALNLGGGTPIDAGEYLIVLEIKEELITAAQDPFLRSANLAESTADRHRLIVDVHLIPKYIDNVMVNGLSINNSPIPYRGSAVNNFVDSIEVTPSGSNYILISTLPLTGAEAVDGRNLEIELNNGNGSSTAALPISNTDIREFIHGKLIDSNGTEFHISNMFVSPGNATRLKIQLDLEKTRPVQLNTFQSYPVITDSVSYKLVKRDLFVTSAGQLPEGKRFYPVSEINWGGATVSSADLVDLRPKLLARDGVLDLIRNQGLNLTSEGAVFWDAGTDNLTWGEDLFIHCAFEGFDWTVAASDTQTLFSGLALNEVLYVDVNEKPLGGSLTLKKGVRGVGDLSQDSLKATDIYWIAKRLNDNRIYFNGGLVVGDQQTGYFYDLPPEPLLPQDILTLGYQALFDDTLYDPTAMGVSSTGSFFADSYFIESSDKVITVAVNNVTIPSAAPFTVVVGDVVVQNGVYSVINTVNSQTDFIVDDGSILTDSTNAIISQKSETINLGNAEDGGGAIEQISTYLSGTIDKVLLTYDDNIIQTTGNVPRIAYSISADGGVTWSDVYVRPESLESIVNEVYPSVSGTDLRVRFFSNISGSDNTAVLESFRVFFHSRNFVGTLIPSAGSGGSGGGSLGSSMTGPSLINSQAYTLNEGRALAITSGGVDYASADDVPTAASCIGLITADSLSGESVEMIGAGLASGLISGLGFSAGDEIYLGLNGTLITQAAASALPPGYVIKQLGFAVNSADMWVQIADAELIS